MNINENAFIEAQEPTQLIDMTFDEFLDACDKAGVNLHTYLPLADDMYWDGHTVAELIQQIEVLEENPQA